tara:strand:- start:93 stop:1163 length:1071 start_codon:yes stop_codon:yes gene_type:complete
MRVCILGGGLSSLTLAKALVNQKILVDLFYNEKINLINKTRTVGISKRNIEYINKNIINIEKILWKQKKIEIFSENLEKEKLLNFENNNEYLFSIIKNYKFQNILQKSLFGNKFFKKIDTKKKIIFKDYDLVINTDYKNLITKKYFNKTIKKKYYSTAYTTIINHKKITNSIATQIFTKKGPLAFLPISNYETSIVYSVNEIQNKHQNIKELIKKYNFRYEIEKISKIETFELKGSNLRKYHTNNILAFGDLLHRIHPLAGQGFNMTIRDIKILMRIIQGKIDLGLPIDRSVCIDFEKKTKHKNFIFSNGIDLIYEFFNLESKTKNAILSKSVQMVGKNSIVNRMFRKIADEGFLN